MLLCGVDFNIVLDAQLTAQHAQIVQHAQAALPLSSYQIPQVGAIIVLIQAS